MGLRVGQQYRFNSIKLLREKIVLASNAEKDI
jgi:hypothetical protein